MRRSGSFARQVLTVRVRRRNRGLGTSGTALAAGLVTLPGGPEAAAPFTGDPVRPSGGPLTRIVPPVIPANRPSPESLAPAAPDPVGFTSGHVLGEDLPGADAATPRSSAPIPLLPGAPTLARRLRFAAVNACTLSSLVLGMSAILLSMHSGVRWAALCLVGCVVFDGMDGALARRLGVASPFGAQMDSLADMCSFGIAAPVVVYSSVQPTAHAGLVAGACVMVAACSAIRLARFNVSPKDGRFFCGVPTTMAAAVLGLAILIGLRPSGTLAVAAIAVLALAMVSGFPYAKLNRIVRLPLWLWLAPVVGAFLDYRITFAALVALYLASGPLVWLRQRTGAPAR
ncbi:CDP-alcohol phosphatidyltransferase family protein [Rugosimonospora acidiphila]|uniref:CDP-alcohol phosphatidyltransferase family protein n=1 Tax=Rugosimonospora acidiphila TaxID=556531 RepID=UPI003CD0AF65